MPSSTTRRRFLLTSAALALAPSAARAKSHGKVTAKTWTNWPGNVQFEHAGITYPRTVHDVASAIQDASAIKAVGSGHSFNGCPVTAGKLLSLDKLSAVRSVDAEHLEVWVEGGLTIRDANKQLARHGLVVPSLGNSFYQSLAGAVSTGTHGSGMAWGSLCDGDSLLAMEIVDGTGTVRTLEIEDDTLKAARVGLGALGVITALKMRVERMTNLHIQRRLVTESQGTNPAQWMERHDHYELFWIPFADRFFTVSRDKTDDKPHHSGPLKDWWNAWVVEYVGLNGLLKKSARHPDKTPDTMARLAGAVSSFDAVDRADRAMTNPRFMKAYDLEFSLPIAKLPDALAVVRQITDEFAASSTFYLNLPVQFRFVRADRGTLLSPAQGRDTVFIDVGTHHKYRGWEAFFAELETRLRAIGGRPHWGKVFSSGDVSAFPAFARWEAVRAEMDPQGKFLNPWIEKLRAGM